MQSHCSPHTHLQLNTLVNPGDLFCEGFACTISETCPVITGPAMPILFYKVTSQQLQISSAIIKPLPMITALPSLTLSSYLQNSIVGSSISAVIDSILSCD